jgi:hypothetical protein
MAIYCKRINESERAWLQNFEAETSFEPMHQDELDSGEMTFLEVAKENLRWFQNWSRETLKNVARFYADNYFNDDCIFRRARSENHG